MVILIGEDGGVWVCEEVVVFRGGMGWVGGVSVCVCVLLMHVLNEEQGICVCVCVCYVGSMCVCVYVCVTDACPQW